LTPTSTSIRSQQLLDLRQALNEAYLAGGLTPPTYSDATLGAGETVKAAHITELRSAVVAIE
jgi:hypothetical protein